MTDKAEALARRYGASAVVRFRDGDSDIKWLAGARPALHPDLRLLLTTSGSTGSPKLVKLSGTNLHSNAVAIAEYLRLDATDRAGTSLRFNYSFGLSVLNSHLSCGASLMLTELSVIEKAFWELMEAHGATSFSGVPHMFEMLERAPVDWAGLPRLRHVAQAGGKLRPELVRHFAKLGADHGWRFHVMYGQTEAAPRMAHLPPDLAADHPDCIGVAIPGGRLAILDPAGEPIEAADQPGELAYSGPNVMMGYAGSAVDLAVDETPARLMTGDIACRNEAGLYYIVGRSSRFIKPFGIRVNLDDVQEEARRWVPNAVVTGSDERVVIAVSDATPSHIGAALVRHVSDACHLPEHSFSVVRLAAIPRLENGKTDYGAILRAAPPASATRASGNGTWSSRYARQIIREARKILGFDAGGWAAVSQIFEIFARPGSFDRDATFRSLGGDSLSYVQVQLALEEYLGHLPDDWESRTIDELERAGYREAVL